MNTSKKYLALDFGAESGRAIVVTLSEETASLEEIHRFPNKPVLLNGSLTWDLPFLFREIIKSLKIARSLKIELISLAVDTWGVDFGLLDEDDQLIGNPVHYRDKRTEHVKDSPIMDDLDLFEITGGFPWNIASLFQLKSMKDKKLKSLERTSTFLNMPDLFNYLLCGEKRSEVTIASTSLIMDKKGVWSESVMKDYQMPSIFPEIVNPGVMLSELRDELKELTGYENLKVLTTCSHDTASVAAVVPDRAEHTAFISSGTWSILGKISDNPVTGKEVLDEGFANEASLDSWYLCKNITGLYPFQELKREWELSDDPWEYAKMCEEAAKAGSIGMVDLEHSDFQSPGHMTPLIAKHLGKNKSDISRGEAAKVLLDSLALEYASNLRKLERLTNSQVDKLFILGGGIKNSYLCQKTADFCGISVVAGIDQGTALGNGLVQAYGLGHISSPERIREIATRSFEMKTYEPHSNKENEIKINRYRELKEK